MIYDLVFEGGGAKGMVFVGAMQEFERRGHRPGRLLGTSAGAITAALMAAGYDANEMQQALSESENGQPVFAGFLGEPEPFTSDEVTRSSIQNFLHRIDIPFVPQIAEDRLDRWLIQALLKMAGFRHLFAFVERGGWYSADRFLVWLRARLDSGQHNGAPRRYSQMTLRQFHAATGVELTLVASDTSASRMLILNHSTAPDCPLVWAVRMSMSIPLLWAEVEWQPAWGRYRGQEIAGHRIVDGGLLSGFPIALFVSQRADVIEIMGEPQAQQVLGMLIDESQDVPGAPPQTETQRGFDAQTLQTVQRAQRLINTMTQAHDNAVIEAFAKLVVFLPARGYGTTEFDMSEERRTRLIAAGRQWMQDYFDGQEIFPEGVAQVEEVQTTASADRIAGRILAQ